MGRKFIKWLSHKQLKEKGEELLIQHADSPEGEKKMCNGRYSVDGFVRRPGDPNRDLVIEVFGCYWVSFY